MSNTLLPCPFCGGEAETFEASEDSFSILCTGCGVETPYLPYLTEAIAAWNSRTGKDINVATNADRIRSMSDEELAEFLRNIRDCGDYEELKFMGGVCMDYVSVIEWLKQPAKEE
jgi:Lar family restriction alleviation protein